MRAGEALREAVVELDPELRVEHVDVLDLAPPWVRSLYAGSFELVAARAPRVWRTLYGATDRLVPNLGMGPLAERLLFRDFRRLLVSGRWRACLCTHFLPLQLIRSLPELPPFHAVVTDFTLHRYWTQRRAGRYFVATPELARELRLKVPAARVLATGIPVSPAFSRPPPRHEARRQLGLDSERPVALVMGGGLGLGVEATAAAALAAPVDGLQVLAVCGDNSAVADRLRSLGVPASRLRVFGYVRDVERLMSAADVVLGKPGGLTASEALAVGRPLLLTRPIPGHEEANLQALLRTGAAVAATDGDAVKAELAALFGDPASLRRLTAAARLAGRPTAAHEIARAVVPTTGAGADPAPAETVGVGAS
jgi:processive 1,2-diacylglycerol beta-glucosyltransferase